MRKQKLLKNKIYSLMLVALGVLSIFAGCGVTFFIFSLMLGIPVFFSKENWIT